MPDKNAATLAKGDVQKQADEIAEKGYVGTLVDPTPNENYTVAGVTSGKPTPETDEAQAEKARAALRST